VVLLGDIMTDLVARLAGPLVPASDSPARISVEGGGAAANTASWLAGLGARSVLLGRVGDDQAGRAAADGLRADGVETRFAVDRQRPTGTVIVLVEPGGERTMVPDPGANEALTADDLPAEVFGPGAHLHLSGYTLLRPSSREAGMAALDLARAAGMTVSVDAASVGPLETAGAERFLAWINGIDVLFANQSEARTLAAAAHSPTAAVAAAVESSATIRRLNSVSAARAIAEHCGVAVVKLGALGALACSSSGDYEYVDAVALGADAAIDSTGAGDAFAAGFLLPWLTGSPLADALRSGCALAARAVRVIGARSAS
jgi:sugar/nucleoside kinase (ribokinase family)